MKPFAWTVWAAALLVAWPALPARAQSWQAPNPYRTASGPEADAVLTQGRQAYAQHCASCHGNDGVNPSAEAPDLRRLNSFCLRLKTPVLATRCQQDVDAYFSQSVQEGKVRAGLVHMPAWKDVLAPQTAWAIQRFVETRPRPQPRTRTSVDEALPAH